jgi:uroporphyrinogen-III synthase
MKSRTVAILESRLSTQLAALIARRGARVVAAPALAETPDVDLEAISRLVSGLAARPAKLAVFQTGVGTRALFEATDALGVTPKLLDALAGSVVAARGPKPSAALRARGVRIDRSAAEPFTTAEVLAAIADVPMQGERALVQRYGASNDELDRALRARGAEVVEVATYRWSLPADAGPLVALLDALERGEIDATVFTSASQAQNLFALAQTRGRRDQLAASVNRTLVASIGPVCSAALRELGVNVTIEASPPKLGPLVEALDRRLS